MNTYLSNRLVQKYDYLSEFYLQDELSKPNFHLQNGGLKDKKVFWSNRTDNTEKSPKSPKEIRTFQNKK